MSLSHWEEKKETLVEKTSKSKEWFEMFKGTGGICLKFDFSEIFQYGRKQNLLFPIALVISLKSVRRTLKFHLTDISTSGGTVHLTVR